MINEIFQEEKLERVSIAKWQLVPELVAAAYEEYSSWFWKEHDELFGQDKKEK